MKQLFIFACFLFALGCGPANTAVQPAPPAAACDSCCPAGPACDSCCPDTLENSVRPMLMKVAKIREYCTRRKTAIDQDNDKAVKAIETEFNQAIDALVGKTGGEKTEWEMYETAHSRQYKLEHAKALYEYTLHKLRFFCEIK